jgi:hypothetical protein
MQKGTGMTDKSVQKLSKRELLEILVSQGKQIEKLQEDLKLATAQLEDKEISIENAGSIAEASLMINNIFADADAACQQYLDNIMNLEQQQQDALDRINEKEAELDRRLQQGGSRTGSTGRRTMPSWTASRMAYQPQEEAVEQEREQEEAWAPAQAQPRATARNINSVRAAQAQAQPQAQYQQQVQPQAQYQQQVQPQTQYQQQVQPQTQYQQQVQPQAQYQQQTQYQPQTKPRATVTTNAAPRAAAARTASAAPRATATVTRPTTVTRTAQVQPQTQPRAATVTRAAAARQTANTATVTAAPKTKRRAS